MAAMRRPHTAPTHPSTHFLVYATESDPRRKCISCASCCDESVPPATAAAGEEPAASGFPSGVLLTLPDMDVLSGSFLGLPTDKPRGRAVVNEGGSCEHEQHEQISVPDFT